MKHCAIKGVPDRLSGVWWASVSLRSSRAPQLINHQGGALGVRSLKPSITTLGGRQSPAHFHALLFPHPSSHLRLSNQGAHMTREALDGGKGGWWVQSKKRQKKRKRKKKLSVTQEVYSSHLISKENHKWIGNMRGTDWMRLSCFPTSSS